MSAADDRYPWHILRDLVMVLQALRRGESVDADALNRLIEEGERATRPTEALPPGDTSWADIDVEYKR